MEQENVQEVASDDIEEVQDEPTLEPEKEKRSVHDYQEESLNEVKRNEEDCNEDGIDGEINLPNTASSLGKTFSCDECTFTERSKYAVSRHKRVAHKKTSFPCKYCDKVWSTSSQCNGHMSRCKRKAETDPGSSQTEASISDKDPTPAPPDDSNDTIPPLRKRLRSKHNSTDIDYICPKCSKSCKTLNGYNKHTAACNPQPPKDAVSLPVNGSFDCQQCDKTYKYKTNYDKHVKDKH